jgi:thiol-disulfide isomerase/thioredoxin
MFVGMRRSCSVVSWLLLGAVACSRDDAAGRRAKSEPDDVLVSVTADELREKVRALRAKAVLVNAWATWCDSCQHELPMLQTLADRFAPENVRVLLVSVDEPADRAQAKSFLANNAIRLTSYIAARPLGSFKSELDPRWPGMLPASFLFDGTGNKVRYFWGGEAYEKEIVPVIEGLLAGKLVDGQSRFDLAPGQTSDPR